jgi:hypothetical protein
MNLRVRGRRRVLLGAANFRETNPSVRHSHLRSACAGSRGRVGRVFARAASADGRSALRFRASFLFERAKSHRVHVAFHIFKCFGVLCGCAVCAYSWRRRAPTSLISNLELVCNPQTSRLISGASRHGLHSLTIPSRICRFSAVHSDSGRAPAAPVAQEESVKRDHPDAELYLHPREGVVASRAAKVTHPSLRV